MKRRKHPQPEPDGSEGGRNSASATLEELEGYVEMGMKHEALRLARQILAQKRISAAELEEVLRSVGVGAFHHISKKHLHRYLAEFDFRWNARKTTDGVRKF